MHPNKTKNFNIITALKMVVVQADYKTVLKKFIEQGNDGAAVKQYLTEFKALKDKKDLGEFKDIDLWGKKSFKEFKDFVKEQKTLKSKTEEKKLEKSEGAELVYKNKDWSIYKIFNHKAAMRYGAGTQWCITEEDSIRWREYTKSNVFYFLLSKNRGKENPLYKIAVQVNKHNVLDKKFWDATDIFWAKLPDPLLHEMFKDKEEMDKILVPFEMPESDWLKELKEKGLTDSVRDEIEEKCGSSPIKYIPEHKFLAFESDRDVGEFVKYSDNHKLKWVYNIIEGNDLIDIQDQSVSVDEIESVLEKLESKYHTEYEDFINKLFKSSSFSDYLEDNYELKIKTIEEFNTAKIEPSTVASFVTSGDDREVENVFTFSMQDASRSASEAMLYKRLERQLLECPVLLFSTGKSANGIKEYILLDDLVYTGCYLTDLDSCNDFRAYKDEEIEKLGIDSFDYEHPDTDEILTQLTEHHLHEYVES